MIDGFYGFARLRSEQLRRQPHHPATGGSGGAARCVTRIRFEPFPRTVRAVTAYQMSAVPVETEHLEIPTLVTSRAHQQSRGFNHAENSTSGPGHRAPENERAIGTPGQSLRLNGCCRCFSGAISVDRLKWEYRLHLFAVMQGDDGRVRRLLAEADRVCDEARRVRERLVARAEPPIWPERRSRARLADLLDDPEKRPPEHER